MQAEPQGPKPPPPETLTGGPLGAARLRGLFGSRRRTRCGRAVPHRQVCWGEVEMRPWPMDFSRADCSETLFRGRVSSTSRLSLAVRRFSALRASPMSVRRGRWPRAHAVPASASSLVPYLGLPEPCGVPAVVDLVDVESPLVEGKSRPFDKPATAGVGALPASSNTRKPSRFRALEGPHLSATEKCSRSGS